MELQPHPALPDHTVVTYANEREHLQFHDMSVRGFIQFALVGVGIRKPMEFPQNETMSNEALQQAAQKLRRDAEWNQQRGEQRPRHYGVHANAHAYKSSIANQLDSYLVHHPSGI
jgi:hypothetical protein